MRFIGGQEAAPDCSRKKTQNRRPQECHRNQTSRKRTQASATRIEQGFYRFLIFF